MGRCKRGRQRGISHRCNGLVGLVVSDSNSTCEHRLSLRAFADVLCLRTVLTNFSGTNQKSIESEKKIRVLTDEEKQIHDSYITPFISSLQKNLFTLVGLRTEVEFLESDTQLVVNGIAVLISITGNSKGRFVLSVSFETPAKFTALLLGRTPEDEIAIESIEEFANIVAGRGVSMINDSLISNDLRISPPGTISGKEVNIINNNKLDNFSVVAKTEIGDFNINIGFTGGE